MKDAFGRQISVGDVVVYATRRSSSQYMHVARVTRIEADRLKVHTYAGTSYAWTSGRSKWNSTTKTYDTLPPSSGYDTTLRTSGNVVLAHGLDIDSLVRTNAGGR